MSADNWRACPACLKKITAVIELSYGKVPQLVYAKLIEKRKMMETETADDYSTPDWVDEEVAKIQDVDLRERVNTWIYATDNNHMMREDRECGVNKEGMAYVEFSCYCENCGSGCTISETKPIDKTELAKSIVSMQLDGKTIQMKVEILDKLYDELKAQLVKEGWHNGKECTAKKLRRGGQGDMQTNGVRR